MVQCIKTTPKEGITKSNPSKRHRERLNAELDLLASLLPFEQNILSKLDRLSILRLSVSYLRIKSYFQVVMHKDKSENGLVPHSVSEESYRARDFTSYDHSFIVDSDMFLQSDIIHQSVYELVHSEDREELQKQLLWNSFLPADLSGIQLTEALVPEKDKLLERSFTVRFRCLLDNTSGFLRLDIRGRVKVLHGQNKKNEEPPLALFAFCTPFGPPSLLEIPPKENMFKSKHKLDFSLVSMDHKGKNTLGYSDSELANMGGYDLVHYDDLAYVASAHQELLKTGASGMIAYRYQKKDGAWQWLQTSSRLVYKNSKPDFVICTHRQLMEEEGRDLLGKRTMDFKVSYLDAGISSTYFESDQLIISSNNASAPSSPTTSQQRANRRYKTQLRDFLSTCRHKRKLPNQCATEPVSPNVSVVDYIPGGPPGTAAAAAAVAAAAYTNTINSVYSPAAHFAGAGPDNVYMAGPVHSPNFYPMPDNIFHQYRLQGVSGYYPEYHTSTSASTFVPTNGLIPYDSYGITKEDTMRWHEGTKGYGTGSEPNQSHSVAGSGGADPAHQHPEAPGGGEATYLVGGFANAPGTDPSSPQVPKSSCHQGQSASPHSSEELVDPNSRDSLTPSIHCNNAAGDSGEPHANNNHDAPSASTYDYIDSGGNFSLLSLSKPVVTTSSVIGSCNSITSTTTTTTATSNTNSSAANSSGGTPGEPGQLASAPSSTNNSNQLHGVPCEPTEPGETVLETADSKQRASIAKTMRSPITLPKPKCQNTTGSGFTGKQAKTYANRTNQHLQQQQQQQQHPEPNSGLTPGVAGTDSPNLSCSADAKWYCTDDA
uniref:BHLH domain-containing protein n=1 Tax=Anopheles atroparvus TaxID=41427 RepID=A0A182J6J6_ANOAO